jgi:hypothetical protein
LQNRFASSAINRRGSRLSPTAAPRREFGDILAFAARDGPATADDGKILAEQTSAINAADRASSMDDADIDINAGRASARRKF